MVPCPSYQPSIEIHYLHHPIRTSTIVFED
jgi:hypothetical protein